ncbi:MAG: phosphatidate cytidylyltransferase [Brumimicrobium sp.]|nr:phosphatidate cytidylyltransferase [Brumimicrobium sp.]MCO5268347.1 phosphatidate cytidylyltransferase [Brumimicrobium sp.]
MNNIGIRTVWGGLFVAIIMAALFVHHFVTFVVLGLFMILGLIEFYNLFKDSEEIKPNKIVGILGGIYLYFILSLNSQTSTEVTLNGLHIIPLLFLPLLLIIFSKNKNPLLDISTVLFSWVYIPLTFFSMLLIYHFHMANNYQWEFLLGMFILVWANDTFAFLFGIWLGKHRLLERISPKKSWEGAIGGFFSTILFSLLYSLVVGGDYYFWMLAAAIISPVAILGDLIESKIKRITNVKDSGTIIPGHGGILDRFDAAMYVAPFFYWFILLYYHQF